MHLCPFFPLLHLEKAEKADGERLEKQMGGVQN